MTWLWVLFIEVFYSEFVLISVLLFGYLALLLVRLVLPIFSAWFCEFSLQDWAIPSSTYPFTSYGSITTLPSQSRLVIDLYCLVLNVHVDLLFWFNGTPDFALSFNAIGALLFLYLLLGTFVFLSNLLRVAHLDLVISLIVICDVLLDSHYVLLTFRSNHLFLLTLLAMQRMWNGSLFLKFFLLFGWAISVSSTIGWILANIHIGIDRALFLRSKQTGVVFGQVLFLTVINLAAHDHTLTQLHGLRINLLRVLNVVLFTHRFESIESRWLNALVNRWVLPHVLLQAHVCFDVLLSRGLLGWGGSKNLLRTIDRCRFFLRDTFWIWLHITSWGRFHGHDDVLSHLLIFFFTQNLVLLCQFLFLLLLRCCCHRCILWNWRK